MRWPAPVWGRVRSHMESQMACKPFLLVLPTLAWLMLCDPALSCTHHVDLEVQQIGAAEVVLAGSVIRYETYPEQSYATISLLPDEVLKGQATGEITFVMMSPHWVPPDQEWMYGKSVVIGAMRRSQAEGQFQPNPRPDYMMVAWPMCGDAFIADATAENLDIVRKAIAAAP